MNLLDLERIRLGDFRPIYGESGNSLAENRKDNFMPTLALIILLPVLASGIYLYHQSQKLDEWQTKNGKIQRAYWDYNREKNKDRKRDIAVRTGISEKLLIDEMAQHNSVLWAPYQNDIKDIYQSLRNNWINTNGDPVFDPATYKSPQVVTFSLPNKD